VVVVARPSFLFASQAVPLDPTAVAIGVVGAVASACAYLVVRVLGRSEDPNVTVFYFPLVATPVLLPFALMDWVWPTPIEWGYLLAVGLFTQLGQIYMTKGLAIENAGRAISMSYTQILFALGWGVLLFGEHPDVWTFAGIALMVAGILGNALRPSAPPGRRAERA
jgi:drug/metabolite transporter (DMT)-like permease